MGRHNLRSRYACSVSHGLSRSRTWRRFGKGQGTKRTTTMLFKSSIVLVFLCGLASIARATTCSSTVNPCINTLNIVNTCSGTACTCSDTSTMTAIDTGCALSTYLGKPTLNPGIYSSNRCHHFFLRDLQMVQSGRRGHRDHNSNLFSYMCDHRYHRLHVQGC